MSRSAVVLIAACTLSAVACGGTDRAIAGKVEEFQAAVATGRLEEIARVYPKPGQSDWVRYFQARSRLGRLVGTKQVAYEHIRGYVVTAWYNSQFEQGHAAEIFSFDVKEGAPVLDKYGYYVNREMQCHGVLNFRKCEMVALAAGR